MRRRIKAERSQDRLAKEHEVRIFVRECLERDDIELPSLEKLSDEDLGYLASAIKYVKIVF